jgi:hypothetical protein
MADEIVKKHKIAPFLDSTPTGTTRTWFRIKKSTAFDLNMNPKTEERDYISDESPTTEITQYKPSLNQALVMHKGEPDYEFVFGKFFDMATGTDAETNILIVFFQEATVVSAKTYYKAWQCPAAISCNDLNSVDSTLSFDTFLNGTVAKGYVEITDGAPAFTEGAIPSV